MCTRTVSTLARALEGAGLATVALLANREAAQLIGPPRGLYCEFPLGRPLGKPLDPGFQHRVLEAAFALLPRTEGPSIEEFDVVIEDEADRPVACPIPPRLDPDEPAAIAEARALRPAYERGVARVGATQVGRLVDADRIPDAIRAFHEVVTGAAWTEVDYLPVSAAGALQAAGASSDAAAGADASIPTTVLMDIRAYYEEAALGLGEGVPAARSTESWYYRKTATGELVRRYLAAVQDADPPFPGAFYVIPASQTSEALF